MRAKFKLISMQLRLCLLLTSLISICYGYRLPMTRRGLPTNRKPIMSAFPEYTQAAKPIENPNFNDVALARALFKYADSNFDQILSPREIQLLYEEVFNFNTRDAAETAHQLINLGDVNGDDLLNMEETILAMHRAEDMLS